MTKFYCLLTTFLLVLAPILAQDEWIPLERIEGEIEGEFTFNDFPDNCEPDIDEILDDSPTEKSSHANDSEEQDLFFNDLYGFPSSIIDGKVNIITGDFHDSSVDAVLPGVEPLELGRFYCGSGCKKHSLFNGWQLNHGAKLFTYKRNFMDYAFIKGGNRHGVNFSKPYDECCAHCSEKFFNSYVTNCCFGEINARTNLRNEVLHERGLCYALENADGSFTWFEKSSRDPERLPKTHGYRVEKLRLPSGNYYTYDYSQTFGMPIYIRQFNRNDQKIAEFYLSNDSIYFAFNQEITYLTSTNEKVKYRFLIYGNRFDKRAVLGEIIRPHAPKIKYEYRTVRGHYKQARICRRILPEGRELQIGYFDDKVSELLAPAGKNNSLVATHTFRYFKEDNECTGQVETGIGGIKEYYWDKEEKRIFAILTFDENDKLFLKERFFWGDAENDSNHLTARVLIDTRMGERLSLQKYYYDRAGNLIRLLHQGNLTGNSKSDIHERHFKYDAAHQCIYEDDGRITTTLTYLEETDLVTARYKSYEGRIQMRHFYLYDASGAVEREFIDDGNSLNREDLSLVTQRTMKYYKNNQVGLPKVIWEYALDLKTGEKKLLHRTTNCYDIHGWLISQTVFDCNKTPMYTCEWQYDTHGNAIYHKDAMGHVTLSKYDVNDNLIFEHKLDNAPFFFTYDCMNRLIKEEQIAEDGTTLTKQFTYDVMGNCLSSTDTHGQKPLMFMILKVV